MIKDTDFKKMSNKDKMKLKMVGWSIYNPEAVLMIRTNRKNDWYSLSAFFIQIKDWWIRSNDYDVIFAIWESTHIDFEYGWIRLFTPNAISYSSWSIRYK